ncbi:MAG: ABC transporter ATP-binding protein [Eubacteriales bacterium]
MKPLLTLKDISYSYHTMDGEIPALSHIQLSVSANEFIAIVGPSGCGKSTLLSIIAALIQPEIGEIDYHVHTKDAPKIQIGYMLQKDHLLEWRSVYENVLLGLEINHMKTKANLERADLMLEKYGLASFRNQKPSSLSGGMRQRVALIRTLVLNPDVLLLDEPFSALDYQTRLSVSDDIYQIIRREGKTAILVTHDLSEAISLGDTVYVLSKRPSTIIKEVNIVMSDDSHTPLAKRNAPEFKQYFNLLWKELNHESNKS